MKINLLSFVTLIGVSIGLGLFIAFVPHLFFSWKPLSTESIIQSLNDNEAQYITLVEMISVDTNIGTIGPDYEISVDDPFLNPSTSDLKVTKERLQEYREILNSIEVKYLARNDAGDIHFGIWENRRRGLVWIPESSSYTSNTSFGLIEIKNGWYIYND